VWGGDEENCRARCAAREGCLAYEYAIIRANGAKGPGRCELHKDYVNGAYTGPLDEAAYSAAACYLKDFAPLPVPPPPQPWMPPLAPPLPSLPPLPPMPPLTPPPSPLPPPFSPPLTAPAAPLRVRPAVCAVTCDVNAIVVPTSSAYGGAADRGSTTCGDLVTRLFVASEMPPSLASHEEACAMIAMQYPVECGGCSSGTAALGLSMPPEAPLAELPNRTADADTTSRAANFARAAEFAPVPSSLSGACKWLNSWSSNLLAEKWDSPLDECATACLRNSACLGFEHATIDKYERCALFGSTPTRTLPIGGYQCFQRSVK